MIAPVIGGVEDSEGSHVPASERIQGGPSVLYDFVAVLSSANRIDEIAGNPSAMDFVSDAIAHCKFFAYAPSAMPLLENAGVARMLDDGCFELSDESTVKNFVAACSDLRYWPREQGALAM